MEQLTEQLTETERHIAQGERLIERQRRVVAEFQSNGGDAREATRVLNQLMELQAVHIADRDRLRKELGL
jgi:hypothetical protein